MRVLVRAYALFEDSRGPGRARPVFPGLRDIPGCRT